MPNFNCLLWKNLFILLFLLTTVTFSVFIISWIKWPELEILLEIKKCPFCYGTELCPKFHDNSIQLSTNFLDVLISFFNVKNIYKATYLDKAAIIKKLGHDWELAAFDSKMNETNTAGDLHDRQYWMTQIKRMLDYNENQMSIKNLIICPKTDSVSFLMKPLLNKTDHSDELTTLINIWTMFQINAEPILLKFLNEDENKWPVPKYYGACGRTAMMEFAGTSLFSYNFKDYYHRIDISIKLLMMAFIFTFQHKRFRFYLTDVSTGNIVINKNGYPIVVDLENVIVLDKLSQVDNKFHWKKTNHSSEVIPCEGCFSFSIDEICSHYLSDHNIYVFCTLIKEDILYNSIEESHIISALSECVNPTRSDRFNIANDLINDLKNILNTRKTGNFKHTNEL